MKKMKRLLAYVLCITMLAGLFPTYASAEGRAIDEPLEQTVVFEGVTTTERTVYVLVDSLTNGGKYLISNKSLTSGSGTGVVLVKNGNSGLTYAEIEVQKGTIQATNEETYSDGYIVLDNEDAVWTAASTGNSWNRSWRFSNDSRYLRTDGLGTLGLGKSGTEANWTYSNHSLARSIYYLYFNQSSSQASWATSNRSQNVYLYQQVTEEATVGQDIIYKVQAEDMQHVLDIAAEGYSNAVQLDYALLKDGQALETLPEGGSYTFTEFDEADIIAGVSETGEITFNQTEGNAYVKVAYTWTEGEETYTAYKYVQVSTVKPSYLIDITHDHDKDNTTANVSVDKTIVIKGVSEQTTYQLAYDAAYLGKDGKVPVTPAEGTITWTTNRPELATVNKNGLVQFKEANGVVNITVVYTYATGESVTDTVAFSISVEEYITPEDGTGAFPEYPNEGSVRFDKTAKAVGTFSETGIAQLELSMTGVPFTEGNTMDVVLMLDHSNSMTEARMEATRTATEVFIKNIVTNTDGSFNKNRIYVGSFAGGNPDSKYAGQARHEFRIYQMTANEQDGYQIIDSQTELDALIANINSTYVKFSSTTAPYGTEYAQSLQRCYEILSASKEDENKQFCVFMSDGIPNVYKYGAGTNDRTTSSSAMAQMFTGSNYNTRDTDYRYEYYSTLMKADGVTVFTVGLGLYGTNSSLSGASAAQCENVSNILLNDISGPAGETEAKRDTGKTVSKLNSYFYSVADADAAEEMGNVFGNIAQKIQEAAKDVKVTDKIADEYTMVFDFPNEEVAGKASVTDEKGNVSYPELYIEAKEYDLIAETDAAGEIVDYHRTGNPNSLMKVYMGTNEDGSYYAACNAEGTAHAAPVFTDMPYGTEYYWTTDSAKGNAGVSVVGADGVTYYFVTNGKGDRNMVSGAYAHGTPTTTKIYNEEVDPVTGEITAVDSGKTTTTYQNLIIATPYFVYNAATRKLVWTAEKVGTKELALTYFLYLGNSGGYVGKYEEAEAGTYETNDYANLDYTNFQGVECEQKFPVPQMTWNGAQVSYVFYLVNKDGIPVNRAGRKIPFSEAVYVTDIYTYSVTWNDENASGKLEAHYLADELVPDVYELYDENAGYDIFVYKTEDGEDLNNHFVINGASNLAETTYVFNTKADAVKYTELGEYSASNVEAGFDFANTTVAFAVLWKPELVEDVVVIDYGLPVDIDVLANDNVAGAVVGLQNAYSGRFELTEINKGVITALQRLPQKLEYANDWHGMKFGDAEVVNNSTVRYTPKSMIMDGYDLFHYVVTMNYYEKDGTLLSPSMYSSVKVVPATNVYFEDTTTFVQYTGNWKLEGSENVSATQDIDRPGKSQISAALDKDNVYGYDSSYAANDTFSLGGSHKVTVSAADSQAWPTASFTFTGTAFDVISLTSNQTGTITVEVKNDEGTVVGNWFVDTYYGYDYVADSENPYAKRTFVYGSDQKWHISSTEYVSQKGNDTKAPANPKIGDSFVVYENHGEWRITKDTDNALYQIPVIKSPELAYDTYTVTITARYAQPFNHLGDTSYDFYLDGIRTYNPVSTDTVLGNGAVLETNPKNETVGDVYKADGEAYPVYTEIRENLLKQNSFDAEEESVNGVVFIDALGNTEEVAGYEAYGPNNEVYLKKGQAVAFRMEDANCANYVATHLGVKSPNGGDVKVTVASGSERMDVPTSSAAEQYYDISKVVTWDKDTNTSDLIILTNTSKEDVMVSLTNVKVTHSAEPNGTVAVAFKLSPSDAAYATSFVYDQLVNSIPTIPLNEVCELFVDVEHDTWYEDAVQYAYNKDILVGDGRTFAPHNDVTRAMVAVILYRLSGSPEVKDYTKYNQFTDLPAVEENSWYTKAVAWALNEGVSTGDNVNMLYNPNSSVTREQLAVFLWRYAQYAGEDVTVAKEELFGSTYVSDWATEGFAWAVESGLIKGAEATDAAGNTYYDLNPQGSAARAQMAVILSRFGETYGL